jgi:pimeloyl-ACP methyl ester carboxylesterase
LSAAYLVGSLFGTKKLWAQDGNPIRIYRDLDWMGPDLTPEFQASRERSISLDSQNTHVVLVPGFLHEWFPGYFDSIRDWLSSLGLSHESLQTKSTLDSATNADFVEAAILKSEKRVVLVAHSRGGVEVLHALLRNPALREKITGVLFIQSPFFGTWVADFFQFESWERFVKTSHLLPRKTREFLFGIWRATRSLTALERQGWMHTHHAEIQNLFVGQALPAITLTSSDDRFFRLQSFEFFRRMMIWKGLATDGVVPEKSMQIPGVPRVSLKRLDHAGLVFRNSRLRESQFQICSGLLHLLGEFDQ